MAPYTFGSRWGGVARTLLLAGAAAALAAACTTGRTPRTPDVGLPAAFEAGASSPLQTAALDRWWTLYGDPELERLVEQALAASPSARLAEARLEEARAIRQGALARFAPQGALEGSSGYRYTEDLNDGGGGISIPGLPPGIGFNQAGTSTSSALNFNVSWELDLFGRRAAARRSAEADLAAARFVFEGARAQLAADTAGALFNARGLAIQLDDAEETLRIANELLRVVRRRVDVGLSAPSDAARVETEQAAAEAEVRRLEAELRAARRQLLVLVGRGVEPTDALPVAAVVTDPPAPPATLPGELLARRPDVREAQARLESAAGGLRTAELEFFPRLNLLPGVGLSLSEQEGFEQRNAFWSLAAGLAVPVLDRPRLRAQLRAQTARAEQAVIGYEQAVQNAFSEAERTLVLLNADRARTAALARGEERARVAYNAAQRRYGAGLDNLQTVLDAERSWRGARSALSGARVQALQRSVQVFQALGGGWSPSLVQTASTGTGR